MPRLRPIFAGVLAGVLWVMALGPTGGVIPAAVAAEKVQFISFLVQTVSAARGRKGRTPVTMLITVRDVKTANFVCAMAPRVRDAVTRAMTGTALTIDRNGQLALDETRDRLRQVVAKTLRRNVIKEFDVVHGAPKVSSAVVSRLAKLGCVKVSK